jgi:lipopolysaccharide export LptBFGC system permease protein LptF
MANKNGRVQRIPINKYRKIALIVNPIVMVILAICLLVGIPMEIIVPLGIIGLGSWLYFFLKANSVDGRAHKRR